ncbi:hypothetical protein FJU30_10655 [Affinibrenneria salicis]|uniref:Uncharacterized protein n=1 Tax=Affinibrenneria salicis TaxID=2590031 RepID=A0A5J5G1Y0_9GAMM|nr:hypothetical protein [Affinibrenneria salicis]KAA9000668.1 hypothetical protein FJU30_10655 [Affinibrenneria salicis]
MLVFPVLFHPARRLALSAAAAAMLLLPAAGYSEEFCRRVAPDEEFPAGLTGQYRVIGKRPISGALYSASLTVGINSQNYPLRLTEGDKVIQGEAWLERCGPDKTLALMTRYEDQEGQCSIRMDGDNYWRVSCLTRKDGQSDGLEAWFQTP